jgi:hypothetical protein
MSKEAKNEIDLLLRQLGRREEAVIFESEQQHLDADELNSYVANALPPPARARYTAHLADCSTCRTMVAQLSAAQPVVVEQARNVPAPSFLKQFLASLFSPMVLRYAVPALAVIVVMVVGFIVMRRDQKNDIAATITTPAQNTSITVPASPSPQSTVERGVSAIQDQVNESGKVTEPKPSADARTDAPNSPAPVQEAPAPAPQRQEIANEAPPPPKAVAQSEEDAERRAQRETPAATTDTAKSAPATNTTRQVHALKKEPETGVASASGSAASRSEGQAPSKFGAYQTATPAGASAARARDAEAKKDESAKAKAEAAEETRSVNGRQFRKSGDVWIDTAYSSQTIVNIRRGSEQYRALVADEPELRSFAERIDGEFIVVWKSRAYRFR